MESHIQPIQQLLKNATNQGIDKFNNTFHCLGKDTIIPMTIRISNKLKYFYECLAEAQSASLQSSIINTLQRVKEDSTARFFIENSTLNLFLEHQLKRFFIILKNNPFDLNNIEYLLSFITQKKIEKQQLLNKENLYSLLDKKSLQKITQLFGYNYAWISGESNDMHYSQFSDFENTWYNNPTHFLRSIIQHYVSDVTAERTQLIFLCNDMNVVKNITTDHAVAFEYHLLPVLKVDRKINTMRFSTYHKMSPNCLNYIERRNNFVAVINQIQYLQQFNIIDSALLYYIETAYFEKILDGSQHVSTYFNNTLTTQPTDLQALLNTTIQVPTYDKILGDKVFTALATITHTVKNNALLNIDIKFVKDLKHQLTDAHWIDSPQKLQKYLHLYIKDCFLNKTCQIQLQKEIADYTISPSIIKKLLTILNKNTGEYDT